MAASSSQPTKKSKVLLSDDIDKYERHPFIHEFKNEKRPVITDDVMFHEETRICNFLNVFRHSSQKHIYFDETYILMFLQKDRNERNKAILRAKLAKKKRTKDEIVQKLIDYNFNTQKNGDINKFWEIYRNSDCMIVRKTMEKVNFSLRLYKAIVCPCYLGDVYSGDTTRAHNVLFVIYLHKNVREIWMYDSMLVDVEEKVDRLDPKNMKNIDLDNLFDPAEKSLKLSMQKKFHLLESLAHCFELYYIQEFYNIEDRFVQQRKKNITYYDPKKNVFTPKEYKFVRTGFSKLLKQEYDNCSSFVPWGMHNLLRKWQKPDVPHRMRLLCYSDLNHRPVISVNQYILAAINAYILRNIIKYKIHRGKTLNVNIINFSDFEEDNVLTEYLLQNVDVIIKNAIKNVVDCKVFVAKVDAISIDHSGMKDLVIICFDRSFQNHEKIHVFNNFLKNISKSTNHLIVIYPDQIISFIKLVRLSAIKIVKNDTLQKLTFALPTWATELKRNRDYISPILTTFPETDYYDLNKISYIVQLPPHGTTHLVKGIDSGFIPFRIKPES